MFRRTGPEGEHLCDLSGGYCYGNCYEPNCGDGWGVGYRKYSKVCPHKDKDGNCKKTGKRCSFYHCPGNIPDKYFED